MHFICKFICYRHISIHASFRGIYYLIAISELTIGFENFSMSVPEAAGTMEVCVIVSEPNENVPIPDVVVIVQTMHFGEASKNLVSSIKAGYA